MKKILVICATFPPQSDVGGVRPAMFCKFLPEFGWEPFVLTRDYTREDSRFNTNLDIGEVLDDHHIFRIPFSHEDEKRYLKDRRLLGLVRDFFVPEYSSPPGLLDRMKVASDEICRNEQFDIILSTSPDQWQLTLGAWLSRKYRIPLIADFRDIGEQEAGLERNARQALQRFRLQSRRKQTVRYAELVTTVSKYHQHTLQTKTGKRTALIYNGFDETLFHPVAMRNAVDSGPLRIVYTGRILSLWYRNPAILFQAIDELISEQKIHQDEILLDFYGSDHAVLAPILTSLNNDKFYRLHESVSYSMMPAILAESQLLLVLTNRGRKGILTTKLFEYIGMRKPILCVPGDGGELDELIHEFSLGASVSSKEEMKVRLLEWLGRWRSGTLPVSIASDVSVFSRRNQAKLLSDEMEELLATHRAAKAVAV